MKTKRNPIADTVERFVRRTGKKRTQAERLPMTISEFFENLQDRGPDTPNSWFERWAVEIRQELSKEGKWVMGTDEQNLEFVAAYISRLQRKFWDAYPKNFKKEDVIFVAWRRMWHDVIPQFRQFNMLYRKIRVWGLRMQKYGLSSLSWDSMLIAYVRWYDLPHCELRGRKEILGLYTPYQCWSSWKFFSDGARNKALRIDPHGLKVPWRDERKKDS